MPSIEEFIASPLIENILSIPGVSERNRDIFKKSGIETTYQLFGMFLLIRGEDKFNKWLFKIGIINGEEIIEMIEEKLNMWIKPSIHDED